MPSILDSYNKDKKLQVITGGDKTPYYSEGKSGTDSNLYDEKSVSALEKKLSTQRYGKGMGPLANGNNDKTPYYSEGFGSSDAKLYDEKSIAGLEKKLSTQRYGKGTPAWGSVYNNQKGKTYQEQVNKK
jgi:hypothetical protein